MAKGKYGYWLTDDGLLLLEAWARDGLTEQQMAHNMGVSLTTLKTYKKDYPSILTVIKKNKEVADIEVENALRKRALGFEYVETKKEYEFGELTKTTTTTKFVPPDVGAAAFWLKNRKPEEWRDKRQVEISKDTSETIAEIEKYVNGHDR